jgi:trigger factor
MKVTLDREGKNVVKLGLELESEKALKAYEVACRQLSQKVNIPGFRKGKAPRTVLEKTLGVDYIKREALERLVPELLSEAITSESLDVITEPEIDSCDFNLGQPLKLHAKFEVRPEVKLGEYKGVSVEVPEAKLPEDSLDKALLNLAETKGDLKRIDPRPVVLGDTALLNFECYVDDKLVDGGKAEGLILEVKEGTFLDGFCEQLVGKSPGEKFEVKVKFPSEYRNKELSGKDAVFKTEITELRQKVTPPIDDELAKAYAQESLEKLKEALSERLNQEIDQENDVRKQRAVVEAIVKNAEVDIPESMIERERDLLLQQLKRYIEQQKQSWEEFSGSDEFEAVKTSKYDEARQRVLTSLVLGAIVRSENLNVADNELMPYLAEVIARYNLAADKAIQSEELRRQVTEEVLTNKVVEFVVSQASIKFVPDSHEHDHEHDHDHAHEHGHSHESGTEKQAQKSSEEQTASSPAKSGGKKSPAKEAKEGATEAS